MHDTKECPKEEEAGRPYRNGSNSLDAKRKAYIEHVLRTVGFDLEKAAVLLEIPVRRLRHLMHTLGIPEGTGVRKPDNRVARKHRGAVRKIRRKCGPNL